MTPLKYYGKHSLCKLREVTAKLTDPPSTINLIIFGGSVTHGSNSAGCCCNDNILEKRCTAFTFKEAEHVNKSLWRY